MSQFRHTLRTILHSLQRNSMRSSLSCLGIVIGIAAVIATMEIGEGSSAAVQDTIASLGTNVVQIDPSDLVKAGASTGSGARMTLTPTDADAILREISSVRWSAPSLDFHEQVIFKNSNWSPR